MANELKGKKKRKKPPDWLIENIAEASKNARKIYFLYIGFLAYCALTVFSTTDRQIILNETARLTIVNLDVSLNRNSGDTILNSFPEFPTPSIS